MRSRLRRAARLEIPLFLDDAGPNAVALTQITRRIRDLHGRAIRQYLPLPYDGRLTLFNVRSQRILRTPGRDRGWGRLARGGLQIHQIEGNHNMILFPPHVQSLAQTLRQSLDQA